MATRKKSSGSGKKTSRRTGRKKAGKKVQRTMREMQSGTLRSGRSRKKVRSRKQAIAIGLDEARREGADVPPRPRKKAAKKGARKRSAKRGGRASRASR